MRIALPLMTLLLIALLLLLGACAAGPGTPSDGARPGTDSLTLCTAESKGAQACTMEYAPVCGEIKLNNGRTLTQTFGNGCSACAEMKVTGYTPGECASPAPKKYVSTDLGMCERIRISCVPGMFPFFDDDGCGCAPPEAPQPQNERRYVERDQARCAATDWICETGEQQFYDETGCGCELAAPAQDACGNGVCEPGEGTSCPACYYETPPCLAPCTMGTCAQDCEQPAASGDYVACSEPRPEICTMEYNPVCAEVDTGIRCITTPCPSTTSRTYATGCTACGDARVLGYVPGACPGDEEPAAKPLIIPCAERTQACTKEYLPVCGTNAQTYGNKCMACADAAVDGYAEGACEDIPA